VLVRGVFALEQTGHFGVSPVIPLRPARYLDSVTAKLKALALRLSVESLM
jgi:hypothetical protein